MQGPPARGVNDLLPGLLVWDAHAGIFPSPEIDPNLLTARREQPVDYVSINVGFDVVSPLPCHVEAPDVAKKMEEMHIKTPKSGDGN